MSTIPYSGKATYIYTLYTVAWRGGLFFHHLLFVKALSSHSIYMHTNYFLIWCVRVCV